MVDLVSFFACRGDRRKSGKLLPFLSLLFFSSLVSGFGKRSWWRFGAWREGLSGSWCWLWWVLAVKKKVEIWLTVERERESEEEGLMVVCWCLEVVEEEEGAVEVLLLVGGEVFALLHLLLSSFFCLLAVGFLCDGEGLWVGWPWSRRGSGLGKSMVVESRG